MLSINKISGIENNYNNKRNKISFQSKFVPNEVLKDAFYIAGVDAKWGNERGKYNSRSFAKIIEHLLNDGKDDLIKVTRSPKGSTLIINGERVNFYSELPPSSGFVDGGRAIRNIVDYFSRKEIVDTSKLTRDEFKAIKPSVDKLNAELNADDVTKNPQIYSNLLGNMNDIHAALFKNTIGLLDKLEAKILNK